MFGSKGSNSGNRNSSGGGRGNTRRDDLRQQAKRVDHDAKVRAYRDNPTSRWGRGK